jgi:hypothetical protein
MQLLLKRSQYDTGAGRINFTLWAKFQLTKEEEELVVHYRVRMAVLSPGDPRRDLNRAMKYAALPALLVPILLSFLQPFLGFGMASITTSLSAGIIAFIVLTYLIYQQIREEIRVDDILAGRSFKCKSVLTLIEKERTITEMAVIFRHLLEAMKTWGGTEALEIELAQKHALRLLEPKHAAA